MDLQGKLDRKYQVQYAFTTNPKRGKSKEGWPSSPEENLERLKDAGISVERGIPKCNNCNRMNFPSSGKLLSRADAARTRPHRQVVY